MHVSPKESEEVNEVLPEDKQEVMPTEAEMIAWYTERLPLLRLRSEFTELQSNIVVAEARRLEATLTLGGLRQIMQDPQKAAEVGLKIVQEQQVELEQK